MYTDQAMNEGGTGYFHRVLLIPLVFFLFAATCNLCLFKLRPLTQASAVQTRVPESVYTQAISMAALLMASLLCVIELYAYFGD